jgi:hypothetical protein
MAGGEHYPSPYLEEALARVYFTEHANAVRLSAFLQFGAAVPLGIFTASAVSRLRFLGVNAAGVDIALFGGLAASFMAALSALVMWTISWPEIAASPGVHALQVASFGIGGPGYVVPLGLLIAGISLAAGLARLIPSWLMWFGIVVAALAELSFFSLIVYAAAFLLPAARLLGFVWMICIALHLPKSRRGQRGESLRAEEEGVSPLPANT